MRDKLAELIGNAPIWKSATIDDACMMIADHLIANGVTFANDNNVGGKVIPVAQKHGRWEEWWPGISLIMTGEEMLYRCSCCDAKYPDVEAYKFCPHCGALMDLEPAEEEKNISL